MGPRIKRVTGRFSLEADQGETLALRIDPIEYQEKLIDMSFFKITVTGFVRETTQSFVNEFDFRFDKPKLLIEVFYLATRIFVVINNYNILASLFLKIFKQKF